jgi:HK97 family phage portal protein
MTIFQRILKRNNKNAKQKPRDILDFSSGINRQTENDATSFSCIDRIASTIAGLSYGIYKTKTGEKVEHPLYDVLKEPNLEETHSLLFHQLILDYFDGNIYLYKYTDSEGNVTNLFRLNPRNVFVNRNEFNQKTFSYNGKVYTADKVLHIPSRFGYDGKIGHSIFQVCADSFSTSQALDDYTNNSFSNNLGKRLVIDLTEAYPNATEEEQKQIRDRYVQNYGGSKNAGKPVVKTGKVQFTTLDTGASDNRASELSDNRNFQLRVISQIFGVPLEYLSGEGATDIEKLTTMFATQAIAPIVQQLEESFNKLFTVQDRGKYYIKFNYNSLLRTSLSNKIDSYTKQMNNGILTVNEIRAKEDLPPIECGDFNYRPSNLLPILSELENSLGASAKLKQAELENIDKPTGTQKNAEAVGLGSELMQ